jgi:phosphoglycolate phosphatase
MRGNLFFDLDGTLTDPREGIVRCLRHALDRVGVAAPTDDQLARFIGPPLQDSLAQLLGPEHADLVPTTLASYRERFRTKGMFENEVYVGVPEGLEALAAAGWRLWVVTSKPRVFAVPILEHFGLARHFAGVHGAELSGERSNKGDLIAYVLHTEGISAGQATMIGDRFHDVVGARTNDVRALGVLWGYGTRAELVDAGAEGVYESFSELVAALGAST